MTPIFDALATESDPETRAWLLAAEKAVTPAHRAEDEARVVFTACEGFFGALDGAA